MTSVCTQPGCDRAVRARGLCILHYEQARAATAEPCSVAGCVRPATKRGWCGAHYWRWSKHGDPEGGRIENGAKALFIATFAPTPTDECLDWPFSGNGNGYGAKVDGQFPHRLICERFHGPAPSPAHEVAHGCGRPPCINPQHLRWATHLENVADQRLHGTQIQGERVAQAKLTEDDVRAIRAVPVSVPAHVVAPAYGVSDGAIQAIRARRTWRHVA